MGSIKTQSIYSTIISYVGVVIGFVTAALIMPRVLATDQLGLIKLITAITGVFASVFSFGVGQLLFRTYPIFSKDSGKLGKLFFLSIKIALFGALIGFPVYILSAHELLNYSIKITDFEKTELFIFAIFCVIVARLLYQSLFGYVRMLNQIVIDAIIQNIFLKGGLLVLIVFFYFEMISFSNLVYLNLALYLFFPIIIVGYLLRNKSLPKIRQKVRFTKSEIKEFVSLSLFGMLTTVGGSLYIYMDTLMVSYYLGEVEVGIYGTMFLFGVIVVVPARSLKSISVSVLAKAFGEDRLEEVATIYKKSSITLLIVGGYIFAGVWCNLYSVYGYLPEAFSNSAMIVFFIGIAQVIDMLTGVNNEIIAASKHYKLNTFFMIGAIATGFVANIIFIPIYGVTGGAIATFISITLINIIRLIAVWKLFRIQPFSIHTLKVAVFLILLILGISLLPNLDNYLLNLIYKGGLITLIYFPVIYKLNVSEDINGIIDRVIGRFKG